MALAKPKRRKIIAIIVIILSLLDDAIDNDADTSLYESAAVTAGHAYDQFWNSDENNWTSEESQAWSAVEALYETVVNQQGDAKLADAAQQLDSALSSI